MDKPLEFILVPKCPKFRDSTVHILRPEYVTSGASGTETDSKAEAILDVLYLQKIRND